MRDHRNGLIHAALGCILLATVTLTGCSEQHETRITSPTSSAGETPPELPPIGPEDILMPEEAREKTPDGAESFVRYYFDLVNRMSTTLDARPLRQLSADCQGCDRIASNAELSARSGYRYEGGEITLTEVAPPLVTGDQAEVTLRLDQTALAVLDASGARLERGSSDAFVGVPADVTLAWDPTSTSWRMTSLTFG
ncbi:DUF6318 family protein [Blastococcus xanthinilyticus]|uniref:DUF6318 domain-containing protein n=1 Tax=Blastococcus xanthinilyticus TaxID=1564164 RepID=A0A5S5D4F6_9ACTN|nr:DUF6318 family protein [Blastococcus xanthinilyticus]TYP90830.1 hypothetical protein BD833_101549 [Blastococcus xanthinilyticus]